MTLLKNVLLGSAAMLATSSPGRAADLPMRKAAPIEYVRVCTAYGAGFFYIPGTDTCLRLSGRARFDAGYQTAFSRQSGSGNGDSTGYGTRLRINVDARTQTGYGTLRAFLRFEVGSRTGGYWSGGTSGTQQRIGNAFPALGIDQFGRAQQYVNADKAFVQLAGITAGRASSFFDFYAHDFEMAGITAGSDVSSTNLLAYTATIGNGFSATLSVEDPTFRRTPIFSPTINLANVAVNSAIANFAVLNSPVPVFIGYTGANPTRYSSIDAIERNRMPDFVGVLRYDSAWGSAQVSAAVHELNVGNVANGAGTGAGTNVSIAHTNSQYGYAVQGGIKVNLPSIAPGDTLYLQGAYGKGAQLYTGYSSYTGSYTQGTVGIQGQKFNMYFSDATISPYSGQMSLSESFTVSAAYLHYWSPELRSAVFGSYGEQSFSLGARAGQGDAYTLYNNVNAGNFGGNTVGTPGTRFYQLSQALRDTYQFVAGASLIWSPVKDLDIGVEGFYTRFGVTSGRVIDAEKDPTAYSAARVAAINGGGFVRTVSSDGVSQFRVRVQRDF